ncbi:MAG TPA: hypothetical protein VHP13_12050 [Gammaproteobacteria bacterium]|jgi:hypothetical protein|nr:hypothetical protein [Gammaproteobacteria bacterium]
MNPEYRETIMEQVSIHPLQEDQYHEALGTGVPVATASAVSWGSIFAGAAAAAGLSLILLFVGAGLGLSSVSPWSHSGVSGTTFGVSAILWLSFTQLAASAVGGYLAGRLRTKWTRVHSHEVFFRDTAHGLLAWCVATLAAATLLSSTIAAVVNSGVQAGATVAGGAATAAVSAAGAAATNNDRSGGNPTGYFVDRLFRSTGAPGATAAPANVSDSEAAAEATRIFASSVGDVGMTADDTHYLGQLVAQRTGLSQEEAERRVSDTYAALKAKVGAAENQAKEAADKARKASAYAALWFAVALFIGAFVASFSATFGGRLRDAV